LSRSFAASVSGRNNMKKKPFISPPSLIPVYVLSAMALFFSACGNLAFYKFGMYIPVDFLVTIYLSSISALFMAMEYFKSLRLYEKVIESQNELMLLEKEINEKLDKLEITASQ
jgi:hypothetical protein